MHVAGCVACACWLEPAISTKDWKFLGRREMTIAHHRVSDFENLNFEQHCILLVLLRLFIQDWMSIQLLCQLLSDRFKGSTDRVAVIRVVGVGLKPGVATPGVGDPPLSPTPTPLQA